MASKFTNENGNRKGHILSSVPQSFAGSFAYIKNVVEHVWGNSEVPFSKENGQKSRSQWISEGKA
jgi:hypothetical protein